jgi:hypothetical protein
MRVPALALVPLFLASPALAQEASEDDPYDKVMIAQELSYTCPDWVYLRQLMLPNVAKRYYSDSHAANAYTQGLNESQEAADKALQDRAVYWRKRATELGCEGGADLLRIGQIETLVEAGAALNIAIVSDQAEILSPLSFAMSDEEKMFGQLMLGTIQNQVGDQFEQFDQLVANRAQQILADINDRFFAGREDIEEFTLPLYSGVALQYYAQQQGYTAKIELVDDQQPLPVLRSQDGIGSSLIIVGTTALLQRVNLGTVQAERIVRVFVALDDQGQLWTMLIGTLPEGETPGELVSAMVDLNQRTANPATRVVSPECKWLTCFRFNVSQAKEFAQQPDDEYLYVAMSRSEPYSITHVHNYVPVGKLRAAMAEFGLASN